MASISGVSGGSGLVGFLQKLTGKQNSNSSDGSSPTDLLQNVLGGAVHGHHHHGGKNPLFAKIESAVSNALGAQGQSSGTSSTTPADPNQTIVKAIAKVLDDAADGSVIPGQDSTGPSNSTDAGQAFSQLLKANGIDAKQFKADFQSAVQQVQQGGVDIAKIFRNFPPGSALDVTA